MCDTGHGTDQRKEFYYVLLHNTWTTRMIAKLSSRVSWEVKLVKLKTGRSTYVVMCFWHGAMSISKALNQDHFGQSDIRKLKKWRWGNMEVELYVFHRRNSSVLPWLSIFPRMLWVLFVLFFIINTLYYFPLQFLSIHVRNPRTHLVHRWPAYSDYEIVVLVSQFSSVKLYYCLSASLYILYYIFLFRLPLWLTRSAQEAVNTHSLFQFPLSSQYNNNINNNKFKV